jgi:hypothetical protein
VSGGDAFQDEMEFLRRLTPEDEERVIAGNAPASDELGELATFTRALNSTLSAQPLPAGSRAFTARLAETARATAPTVQKAPRTDRLRSGGGRTRPRRRRALVARVAVAIAAIPLLFAGLAFAGVTLPGSAQAVFDSLGLELPNQPTEDDDTEGTAKDGDSAGSATGQENSAGKLGHGKAKSNKARDAGRGHGKQGKGRALGKRGLAPGKAKGEDKQDAGSQGNSGTSGGGGGSSGKSQGGTSRGLSSSGGTAKGQSK